MSYLLCLNPCCNGCCSLTRVVFVGSEIPDSLNPCCNGCCSLTICTDTAYRKTMSGLNPCCNGCCSLTPFTLACYVWQALVLILVVMDAVL